MYIFDITEVWYLINKKAETIYESCSISKASVSYQIWKTLCTISKDNTFKILVALFNTFPMI